MAWMGNLRFDSNDVDSEDLFGEGDLGDLFGDSDHGDLFGGGDIDHAVAPVAPAPAPDAAAHAPAPAVAPAPVAAAHVPAPANPASSLTLRRRFWSYKCHVAKAGKNKIENYKMIEIWWTS